MNSWVSIQFDCVPLRSVRHLEAPEDASPKFRALVERIGQAIQKHGRFNSYYLHHAQCVYHLTNSPDQGRLEFEFEGTLLTDPQDLHTVRTDLDVQLRGETCDWITEPVVRWFKTSVENAVKVEFDRYIEAGDLERTRQRIEQLEQQSDKSGGFLGMGL